MPKKSSTVRWTSQHWILDNIVKLSGMEQFTGGSWNRASDSAGVDASSDINELRATVKKLADVSRQCKRLATRREALARDFESQGHRTIARECYLIAAVLFGCARWPIWDDDDSNLISLTNSIADCYVKYANLSEHFVQRVEIPFEGKTLYGYFHLPNQSGFSQKSENSNLADNQGGLLPCVVVLPGMDTFKEELVRMYGDRFLQRGFSVLAVEGPGQGETVARGLKLTADNFDRAGKAIFDYLAGFRASDRDKSTVDQDRISITATSFGSYWGPRIMAFDQQYIAGAFSSVCHEPHMDSIFNSSLPTYKPRHMWMCGIYDEEEFDNEYRPKLTLEGVGEKIDKQRIFIAGGGEDPLSPIKYTLDFYKRIASPQKQLLVYEGEEHGISDSLLSARIANFMDDASKKKSMQSGVYFLERASGWKLGKPVEPK